MCKEDNKVTADMECGVSVKVDVAKIVKYISIAGVLIVAIIFGSSCLTNMLKTTEADL